MSDVFVRDFRRAQRGRPGEPDSPTRVAADAILILNFLGKDRSDLSIWLTTGRTIRRYNKKFRGVDSSTDILSFPTSTNTIKHQKYLGDIMIAVDIVKGDRTHLGGDFAHRMCRLLTHGICHLLGFTHDTDKDYVIMLNLEEKIMRGAFNMKLDPPRPSKTKKENKKTEKQEGIKN